MNLWKGTSVYVSVSRGSYDKYFKHKKDNPSCNRWDYKGTEKKSVSIYIAHGFRTLIVNERRKKAV